MTYCNKKSQAKIVDTIAIITIIALVVVFATTIGTKIFKTIESIMTSANPKMLSVEISSLMTISGVAPEKIKIDYKVKKYNVNITIEKKILTVENKLLEKYTDSSYESAFANNFLDVNYDNINHVSIAKERIDENEVFDINAINE